MTINEQLIKAILIPGEAYERVDKASEVVDNFAISFSVYCAENTFSYSYGKWRMKVLYPTFKTTEELLTIFKQTL